jgi:cell division protein ZapA (FtsZ GTPase activity inhibitor)
VSKKSVAVRIAGHEYKILTEGDGASLRQIAGDVDRAMKRVRDRTGTVDTLDIAVLTCLNLAREIIELRDQSNAAASDERLRGLIDRVEALLPERKAGETSGEGADEKTSQEPRRQDAARTLDLPSFEALRERTSGSQGGGVESADAPMPRVAAGGRDRAS